MGATTAIGVVVLAVNPFSSNCPNQEIELMAGTDSICLTEIEYDVLKHELLLEYEEQDKGFDFHISNRGLVSAVIAREVKTRKGLTLEGVEDKNELKAEVIKLLK